MKLNKNYQAACAGANERLKKLLKSISQWELSSIDDEEKTYKQYHKAKKSFRKYIRFLLQEIYKPKDNQTRE